MQEILFNQQGRSSFFSVQNCQVFYSKKLTAVVSGQHGSEAIGPGSSLCRAKFFNDFTEICQKFQCLPWHSG